MHKIESFELDRWSEPDEQRRIRHIGMANSKETFNNLKSHLEKRNMLPDEYFLYNGERYGLNGELPDFSYAECISSYGESEGIYLDITLVCHDTGKVKSISFATGKTLAESGDAFLWMSRIAAECSLMLNGRGSCYILKNTELTLSPDQVVLIRRMLEHSLHNHNPVNKRTNELDPEAALLSGILKQIDGYASQPNKGVI